jgi:integrase
VWLSSTRVNADLAVAGVTFGDLPLRSIRRSHIEAWVKNMTARLAPTTIDTRFTIVRGVFRAPVADRLIATDPTAGVVLPRKRKAEAAMRIPTHTDVAKLLNAAEPSNRPRSRPGFSAYVALSAFAGLRRGEALGVQVGDIDFLGPTLRVTRQLQRARLQTSRPARTSLRPRAGSPLSSGHRSTSPSERSTCPTNSSRSSPSTSACTPTGEPDRWLFDECGKAWHDNLVDYRWRSTRTDAGLTHRLHDYAEVGIVMTYGTTSRAG